MAIRPLRYGDDDAEFRGVRDRLPGGGRRLGQAHPGCPVAGQPEVIRSGWLRLAPPARAWAATLALLVVSIPALLAARDIGPAIPGHDAPFWALCICFMVGQPLTAHVAIGRQTQTIDVGEIGLVFWLFFIGHPLLTAPLIGISTIAGSTLRSRQDVAAKFAFAAVQVTAVTSVMALVWHGPIAAAPPTSPLIWLAVLGACATSCLLTWTATSLVLSAYRAEILRGTLQRAYLEMVALPAKASVAGLLILVYLQSPVALVLFVLPAAALLFAFREIYRSRRQAAQAEMVWEVIVRLAGATQIDSALVDVLTRVRSIFACPMAELTLRSSAEGSAHQVCLDDGPEHLNAVVSGDWLRRLADAAGDGVALRSLPARGDAISEHLAQRRCGRGLVVPIRAGATIYGLLVAAGPAGERSNPLGAADLAAARTLCAQIASTIENSQLGRTLTTAAAQRDDLQEQVMTDALTGLGNRIRLNDRLSHALSRQKRSGEMIALLFVDLDDFKGVNDRLGHAAGDELLAELGRRIRECVREQDTPVRLGGDEFAVLLEDLGDPGAAAQVAARMVARISEPVVIGGAIAQVWASIGVAISTGGIAAPDLVARADQAMYAAKKQGKNRYVVAGSDAPASSGGVA